MSCRRSYCALLVLFVVSLVYGALTCVSYVRAEGEATEPKTSYSTSTDTPAAEAIRKALAMKVDVEFLETRLSDVVTQLRRASGIEMQLDVKALSDVGIALDTIVTRVLKQIPLKSALKLMLRDLDMEYVIRDDVLLITTTSAADAIQETRIYPVADLIYPPGADRTAFPDYMSLVELFTRVVAPTTWGEGNNPGIHEFQKGESLLVHQSQEVHELVEALLVTLRHVAKEHPSPRALDATLKNEIVAAAPAVKKQSYSTIPDTPAAEAIHKALTTKIDLKFAKAPLTDVLEYLRSTCGIEVQLDAKALADGGVDPSIAITCDLKQIPLKSGLNLILPDLELRHVIFNDALFITTDVAADAMLGIRVYPVGDLIYWTDPITGETRGPDYDSLITLLTSSVWPTSWAYNGSSASVVEHRPTESLVILQTAEWHEQIEARLSLLRRVAKESPRAGAPGRDQNELYLRVYHLGSVGGTMMGGGGGFGGGAFFQVPDDGKAKPVASKAAESKHDPAAIAEQLARLIPDLIQPPTWQGAGGKGKIYAVGSTLVVRQTEAVHRLVQSLIREFGAKW